MYLVFDIGGTHMRVGLSPDGRTVTDQAIFPTPDSLDETINLLKAHYLHHSNNVPLQAAAGGIAGALSHDRSTLLNSPHKPHWNNQPIKQMISTALGIPVFIENDAAIVGLGEATTGPGMGKRIVVYITVSTGVGGARIVDGKIDPSYYGFEPGHQIVSVGEKEDGSPVYGYLEDFVSGAALKKAFGKLPEEIHDPQVWDDVAFFLALGLNNIIVHWSPDIIVLGGSEMKSINLDVVKKYLKEIVRIFPELPEIEKAKIDYYGGLYGALEFLKQNLYNAQAPKP